MEQLGLKIGILCGTIFPLLAVILMLVHIRKKNTGNRPALLGE
jgi:hypothetical protein